MAPHIRQTVLALESLPDFAPEDLVIGKANAQAFALLQQWPIWRSPITILIGDKGSGKSHMAACWQMKSGAQALALNEPGSHPALLDMRVPILIEDIVADEFDETALFHLINAVMQARIATSHASLLLTSSSHPSTWHIRLADLASRIKAAQLAEIATPDDMLLQAVLTKLFADRQLLVDPQLISYCVSRMERSFAAAVRFVAKLDRLALAKKSRITRPLALMALEQFPKSVKRFSDKNLRSKTKD